MRRPLLFAACFTVAIACAERQALPPGIELEHVDIPDAGEIDGGVSELPKASDKELAGAWEEPPPPPKPKAPEPSPEEEEATVEQQLNAQAEAEARAKLKDLLVSGRHALGANSLDEAKVAADEGLKLAEALTPAELQQAVEQSFRVAYARVEIAIAVKTAERWLKSCGPDRVDFCRARAVNALQSVAKLKGASVATVTEKVKSVRDDDTCVQQAEASRALAPCLDVAAAHYRRQKDRLMVARISWARAVAALADARRASEVEGMLKRVESDCSEARCAAIRRKALKTTASIAFKSGDLEGAAAATLKEMRLSTLTLPADRRPYARSPDVDRICAAYDAKAGAGSCRKLEKKLNGEWIFRDFSLGKTAALAADRVKSVNEHFNCLLEECLTIEADRLTPPDSITYDVLWDVTNDGRVGEVHLGRKDLEEGPMFQCLKKQFGWWRYPRYQGELQHVAQRFTVSAHERRTR